MRSRVALAGAVLLLAPAGAGATTRYVSPYGAASGDCAAAAPCTAAWAIAGDGSAPGDEIVIGPGDYVDQPLVVDRRLTVTAAPDAPRPVFRTAGPGAVALQVGAGGADSVIEHLDLRSTGSGGAGLDIAAAATLSDLVVGTTDGPCLRSAATGVRIAATVFTQAAPSAGPCAETTGDDTFWDDVRVTARKADTAAAFSGNGSITDVVATGRRTGLQLGGTAAAHRVTATGARYGIAMSGTTLLTDSVAVAHGRRGAGVFTAGGNQEVLYVTAWAGGKDSFGMRASTGGQLTVTNSIARGRQADLIADPESPTIGPVCADIAGCEAGSIFADHSNFRDGFAVEYGPGNQLSNPRFVKPGAGNFHVRAGSSVIDAGTFELNATSADRAGRFRWLGLRPDMGAYEFPSPRPRARRLDVRPPNLIVARLTRSVVRPGRPGVAFSSAVSRPVGTTLVYATSEDVDLVVLLSRVGLRSVVGTIVRPSTRGVRRLTLSGLVGGRPLPAGRYALTVIARDRAQNISAPRTVPFTVVR